MSNPLGQNAGMKVEDLRYAIDDLRAAGLNQSGGRYEVSEMHSKAIRIGKAESGRGMFVRRRCRLPMPDSKSALSRAGNRRKYLIPRISAHFRALFLTRFNHEKTLMNNYLVPRIGLAPSHSLGPQRASASGGFLSPLPKRLKSAHFRATFLNN